MNTILLNLNNWFLFGFKKNAISNGTINQNRPAENEAFWLPALPTQVIVLKELYIKTVDTHRFYDFMSSQTATGVSFGFGPFSISGHYEHNSSQGTNGYELQDEGVSVKGVQIIGWISQ